MTRTRSQFTLLTTLLATLLSGAPAGAQTPGAETGGEQAGSPFFDFVEVQVVNIRVMVTDKRGDPITGLTKEDFELYEDGRPVEISNFYAAEGGRPVRPAVTLEALEVESPAEGPIAPIPEDQRLHLIVYVDNFNILPGNRNRVIRDLRAFLYDYVEKQDRVMVVSYDRSFHIRQPFTSDRGAIADALTELEELSGSSTIRLRERRLALDGIEEARYAMDAMLAAEAHADSVYTEMRFTIRALDDMVQSLAGLRGRKAVLYVSDGIPLRPAEDLFELVDSRFPRQGARLRSFNFDLSNDFRALTSKANAADVSFYTLDARGLESHMSLSAEEGGTIQGGSRIAIDTAYVANLQAPLHRMADDTGGQAITNTNAVLPALERIAHDFETFYSLGYRPNKAGEGRYHSIEVKVKDRDLVVRHREGYRDKTASAQLADGTLSSLYFDFETNPIGAQIAYEPSVPQEDGRYILPVLVKIPLDQLALIPRANEHHGRIRVAVATMDDQGRTSPVQEQPPLDLRIPAAELEGAMGQHFTYEVRLLLRAGPHHLAVAVRDEISSQASFLSRTVRVGSG